MFVCYSNICSNTTKISGVFSAITSYHVFLDFDTWISLKAKVMAKLLLFAALALSALRQLRVQSDLLNGTAFEALALVVLY